jgi:hypothetical protein
MKLAQMFYLSAAVLSGLLTGFSAAAGPASSDALGKLQIKISHNNSEIVLNKTLSDVRAVFQNYHPALDSSTKIKSPVRVSGSSTRPFVEVTMEKCVVIVCQTVDMKADITVKDTDGKCTKNFILRADLTRSSEILTNVYDSLDVVGCYQRSADGQGILTFGGSAHHAPKYSGGPIQNEIYQLLKLQLDPIASATKKVLKQNGATL